MRTNSPLSYRWRAVFCQNGARKKGDEDRNDDSDAGRNDENRSAGADGTGRGDPAPDPRAGLRQDRDHGEKRPARPRGTPEECSSLRNDRMRRNLQKTLVKT